MSDIKLSPKLQELCKWKYIDQVNDKLDSGETPNSVTSWINKHGFKISNPLIYEYAKIRKKALVDGININHMLGIASKPLIDKTNPTVKSNRDKLKSEIDALDMIIQGGFNTLKEWADRPIAPKTMMDAIKLKNDLTDGNHGFLTNFGMEQLREIEQGKYELIFQHLLSYIPEEQREEAIDRVSLIEDEYYQTTDYYEEYVSALDIPEYEKQQKIAEYYRRKEEQSNEDNPEEELFPKESDEEDGSTEGVE